MGSPQRDERALSSDRPGDAGEDPEEHQVGEALAWIAGLLAELSVPFLVVGGLAARAYGSGRPVIDIDLYVPADGARRVAAAVEPHVTRPLAPHRDEHWDLEFMQLEYRGQAIELGIADGARYRDARAGRWREAAVDFGAAETHELFGVRVPVMPREQLVAYKRRLRRAVDRADLAAMASGSSGSGGSA